MRGPSACATCPLLDESGTAATGERIVVLAGNPNTGKSTVFNALTGLRQHTGNWPGKTVSRAEGRFQQGGRTYRLMDLPGTYSLLSTSEDETIARNAILFGRPDVTVIVVDAGRLERNLNLVLQVLAITDRAVVCLNLMDEAAAHGVTLDHRRLARELGVPVVPTSARWGEGLSTLTRAIEEVAEGRLTTRPRPLQLGTEELEKAMAQLAERLGALYPELPSRNWVALRLLDGDSAIVESVRSGQLGALGIDEAPAAGSGADAVSAEATEALLLDAEELRWTLGPRFHDRLVEAAYAEAGRLAAAVVRRGKPTRREQVERWADRLLTSRLLGFPVMILLLTLVFWITVTGANAPSALLSSGLLDTLHPVLKSAAAAVGLPWWLDGILIDGVYLATAWVVSVMLPPMAIFFPLFTLLEDLGYLPRVAFNLDHAFRRAGGHGKQALTMSMGFGCNAAGVVAARIIESPRERLIAIVTNNFALCNGRWPTQILVATIFIGALAPAAVAGLVSALAVVAVALLGVLLTLATSWGLSRTVLRGEVSVFTLELPPYRPPRVLRTLYTSLIDRTLYVLWRAVLFAAPAGAVIWLLGNVELGGVSLAAHITAGMEPFGYLIGLSGIILLAFVVAIPANEIVIPTVLMLTVLLGGGADVGAGTGVLFELETAGATGALLRGSGWTLLMAVNLMLFSLVHNPCSTTLFTIWKETRSAKWTALAAFLPLVMGLVLCFIVAQVWRLAGG